MKSVRKVHILGSRDLQQKDTFFELDIFYSSQYSQDGVSGAIRTF